LRVSAHSVSRSAGSQHGGRRSKPLQPTGCSVVLFRRPCPALKQHDHSLASTRSLAPLTRSATTHTGLRSSATMYSDLEETNGLSRHVVRLDGHDNYKEWLRYLRNLLIRKDLFDVANWSEERPMDKDLLKAWKRSDLKAFKPSMRRSQNVQDNLPIDLTDYQTRQPQPHRRLQSPSYS
jgi:hypothetical protein